MITQFNTAKSIAETTSRQSQLLPYDFNYYTREFMWADPKYFKIMKYSKPLGTAADIANSLGIIYNFADQGVTTENVMDSLAGAIGYYPILGDMIAGDYAVQKHMMRQVVTGRVSIVPRTLVPIYQWK